MNKNNVSNIDDTGLCCGCGTCVGMCPKNLVSFNINKKGTYAPKVDNDKCLNCGICLNVCPGIDVNFKQLNMFFFKQEPYNNLIGNYEYCAFGYSNNGNLRKEASSGGILPQLLIFALETGMIDGAIVTKMNEKKPLEPEVFIAKTKEDIISATGSKYCPVPVNIILNKIRDMPGRFAVVGLPCHIQGIRKAELHSIELRNKIVLHIGLFCNHSPSFLATEYILQKYNIEKEDIKRISYRGEGWPGAMRIKFHNSKDDILISLPDYYSSGFGQYFHPTRCSLCYDGVCELSDIAFGDAWLPEFKDDNIGTSILIVRSSSGDELLQKTRDAGLVSFTVTTEDILISSQKWMLHSRKNMLKCRLLLFRMLRKKTPNYHDIDLLSPRYIDYIHTSLNYVETLLFSLRFMWSFISIYKALKQSSMQAVSKISLFINKL